MKRISMLALAAVALVAGPIWAEDEKAADAKDDNLLKVRLYVEGAYCPGCAEVLELALKEGGVLDASKLPVNRGRGHVIVLTSLTPGADLSKTANAVNQALTPHKDIVAPGLSLELYSEGLTEEQGAKAVEALKALEGIGKDCRANTELGVIVVRLAGGPKLTLDKIQGVLKEAGVEAKPIVAGKGNIVLGEQTEEEPKKAE